jgi:hypothetical protein
MININLLYDMSKNSENMQHQLQHWIRNAFRLSNDAVINISEYQDGDNKFDSSQTEVTIEQKNGKKFQYQINKSITEVAEKDIKRLRRCAKFEKLKKLPIIGNLFRFLGLWLAFTGVYAMFSVCPFCGQVGCPVGAGSAGIVGGFFALTVQNMKNLLSFMQHKLSGSSK